MTKEEFLKYPDATEWLYNCLQKSKEGHIRIRKDDDSIQEHGFTDAFGEGISLYLSNPSRWYQTSTIKQINWKEGYFDTKNSRYYFDFKEFKHDSEREDSESNDGSHAD